MPYLNDYIPDLALAYLDTDGNRLDICSTEPTTYTQAITTYSLGNKTSLSIGAPTDRTPNGRKVTVATFSDGTVTANGTAAYWAIVSTTSSRLIAANALASSQVVTTPNSFSLAAFDIGIPDAVSE